MTADFMLQIRSIARNSPAYQDMVGLRYRVLREPLGLTFTPEQLAAESADTLLAAYQQEALVGCLILTRHNAGIVQMRQVAVEESLQGQGIGRALVEAAEQLAREQGYTTLLLHARESAVPFYRKLGYEACGEPFEEVTLPHLEMRKTI